MANPNSSASFHRSSLRRAVLIVALANFSYFFVEFIVARHIGAVSLFADSIDFLEDAAVNGLIVIAALDCLAEFFYSNSP